MLQGPYSLWSNLAGYALWISAGTAFVVSSSGMLIVVVEIVAAAVALLFCSW